MAKEYDWYFRLLPPHYADVSNPVGLYRTPKGIIDFEAYCRDNKWHYTDITKDHFEGNIELVKVKEDKVIELFRRTEFVGGTGVLQKIKEVMYKDTDK